MVPFCRCTVCDVILGAASVLRELPVRFTLIGGTAWISRIFTASSGSLNCIMSPTLTGLSLKSCGAHCPAQLGLGGPFGNTGQPGV